LLANDSDEFNRFVFVEVAIYSFLFDISMGSYSMAHSNDSGGRLDKFWHGN